MYVDNNLIDIIATVKLPDIKELLSRLEQNGKDIASVLSKPGTTSFIECLIAIGAFKQFLSHPSKEVRNKAAEIIIELIKELITWLKLESKSTQKALGQFVLDIIKEINNSIGAGYIELSSKTMIDLKSIEKEIKEMVKEEDETDRDLFIRADSLNQLNKELNTKEHQDKFIGANQNLIIPQPTSAEQKIKTVAAIHVILSNPVSA